MVRSRAKIVLLGGLSSLLVAGCASSKPQKTETLKVAPAPVAATQSAPAAVVAPKAPSDEVVATINDEKITMSQLTGPMLDSVGLSTLMNIVKLDLARQNAVKRGVTISEDDVTREKETILAGLLPDADKKEYPALLEQFLDKERLSHQEFDMLVRTRAYLRAMAEPLIKQSIIEKNLVEAFNARYGETIKARHIQCSNMQEIGEAQRRLRAGEPFEQVAKELSRNPQTKDLGGELPAFSRQTQGLSDAFKQAAFLLKEGEISDAVETEGSWHLIKVEKRIAPKAVKYEDVKDAVRKDLIEALVVQSQKELMANLGQQALLMLHIENSVLKKQFEEKLHRRDAQLKDREEFRKDLEKNRPAMAPAATEEPVK